MNQLQNDSKVIDVLGAYRTISGKSIECISVLCIVPFAEGLVDDIVSCDESVSVLSAEAPQGKAIWVGVDFGTSCTASITSMGFAHGSQHSKAHVMGSFFFQGSNDGKQWVKLLEVAREKATVMYCGWNLAKSSDYYRYFRIMMTSPTSSNSRRVCIKNLTLHGSILVHGKPYSESSTIHSPPKKIQNEQINTKVANIRPSSGNSSLQVMQIYDSSLTNLIHIVANVIWIVSSTQGLCAAISSYKIEPPEELLTHACSAALCDIVAVASVTSEGTYLESMFSYLLEMLVELSNGDKNTHIYRLFLFGRNNNVNTPYMKVHTNMQKLTNKLAALLSDHHFKNMKFKCTISFQIASSSPADLQTSKNQLAGIAEMARKGLPISRLPPFDVSSLVEFKLRHEVHILCSHNVPGSLVQHVEMNSESNKSESKKIPNAEPIAASLSNRVVELEAKLNSSLLREHALQSKLSIASSITRPQISEKLIPSAAVRPSSATLTYDAKIKNLENELKEAARREEALKTAPYFGKNPTETFDVEQLKLKLQTITNQLMQKDETIQELDTRLKEFRNSQAVLPEQSHVTDASDEILKMQLEIDSLKLQVSNLQLSSKQQEVTDAMVDDKKVASIDAIDVEQTSAMIKSLEDKLHQQEVANESLSTAVAQRDKQVRDLDTQIARLQLKLQESYDEVDELRSEQTALAQVERIAELESELEQAAMREENLQQMMVTWSSEDDKRRIRDLERELIMTKRKEEELRNAPPPPPPIELIEKIRSLEEELANSTYLAQSLKRKLEESLDDAKLRSENWAITEAELRSACLQWSPEIDRKRILELQEMVKSAKQREESLHDLLQQKPKLSKEEEEEFENMKNLLIEHQLKIANAEEMLLEAPSKEQLIAKAQEIEDMKVEMKMSEARELSLKENIDKLQFALADKNKEIEMIVEKMEERGMASKSKEDYLMFEISQLKERLPENRDNVIEGLKLVKAEAIEKTRSQKAEIQELQKLRVNLEQETKLKQEAEAKLKQLESKSKEMKKNFDAEKASKMELQSKVTELELVIQQEKDKSSLEGLPPSQKDHKLEALMLNSKRAIVGLDKQRRAAQEKEKESTRRNQDLKTQASKAQVRMQQAMESEQEMQIRLETLSQCTSYEAKVASTIVDSLSVAAEQRLIALESERDEIKLQEQAVLKQLEEMELKVIQFEKTKQEAQANESMLAIEVTKLRKLIETGHNPIDGDVVMPSGEAADEKSPDAILQTTLVQEYVQSEISKAKNELQAVLESNFVATLAEFEIRKGDAVHNAFIKADETVVQRIQNFVDEKAEIMKHMNYLTRAHADSNMAAKLAEEKLNKLEPVSSQRNNAGAANVSRVKASGLPPIKKEDISTIDSFPRRLLSIGTSPMPGARAENDGPGVGFVSEEVENPAITMSPYAQTSAEPIRHFDLEMNDDLKSKKAQWSQEGVRILSFEDQLNSEKKKVLKLASSLKAAQDEKIALQVELATQKHLTDVCQEELQFLRKQTKKGFLPRFLDKSPTRQERVEKDLEIRDDLEDTNQTTDLRSLRPATGPVQFVLDRGSSQKFAGVSINTMKKLNDDDLQRIKAYSPNLFKTDKKKIVKRNDASEAFASEFSYPKSKFEQLADEWMFDEPSIKKRQEKMILQEHLQSLKNKAMKQQAVLFAVASKQGVKVPTVNK